MVQVSRIHLLLLAVVVVISIVNVAGYIRYEGD
jgi:hypothetical protein